MLVSDREPTTPVERGVVAESSEPADATGTPRRSFLVWLSSFAMGAGLLASYGTLAAYLGRFLLPSHPAEQGWMFVTEVASMPAGGSLVYRTPMGSPVSVTRQGAGSGPSDFVALSSTCPHLGCQVNWESQNNRFFCPCHNGTFDASGKAVEGPPAEAGQALLQYPMRISKGMLFIQVPIGQLADGGGHLEQIGGRGREGRA
jgi:nitrite reductase/ring-hydroxylating ferredoxin subunit